jgi:glycosyltransferase involved in cell wall biosynthesis
MSGVASTEPEPGGPVETASSPPLPIIAFARDWDTDLGIEHHVLRELARSRRVLWLETPVSDRAPDDARSPGDALAGIRAVLSVARAVGSLLSRRVAAHVRDAAINVERDLWIARPPPLSAARTHQVQRQLLHLFLRTLRTQLGIHSFQLWSFVPTVADHVGALGEELSIYFCAEEWSLSSEVDQAQMLAAEHTLIRRVDAVVTTTHLLGDAKRALHPATYVAPNGVDHAHFVRALDDATKIPADLAALPRPRIGFHGSRDGLDLELIAHVARTRPDWSLVLIGPSWSEIPKDAAIRGLHNVHLLGKVAHDDVPAYCKGLDVGMLPYRIEPRTTFVNPPQLREYLSAGLPVVSTPIPEVKRYASMCRIAEAAGDVVPAIEHALKESGPVARGARSAAMKNETWSARVTEVMRTVEVISQRKRR